MSKKPHRYRTNTVRPALGRPPLSVRLWSGFYAWSGLPYAYNDRVGHWLIGLGLFTVGVLYAQQVTYQTRLTYYVNDAQTAVTAAQDALQAQQDEAAITGSLEATKQRLSGWVPVTDVEFVTR